MNAFENEVSAAAKHLGLHYQKLTVGTVAAQSRFTAKSPYDSFFIHDGRHVALELKSLEKHGSLPLANIHDHQIDGLKEVMLAGGDAYLLVNMRAKDGKSLNQAWYLDMAYWDELLDLLQTHHKGRKSVPYSFFTGKVLFQPLTREHLISKNGEKKLVWNLATLLPWSTPIPVHQVPVLVTLAG